MEIQDIVAATPCLPLGTSERRSWHNSDEAGGWQWDKVNVIRGGGRRKVRVEAFCQSPHVNVSAVARCFHLLCHRAWHWCRWQVWATPRFFPCYANHFQGSLPLPANGLVDRCANPGPGPSTRYFVPRVPQSLQRVWHSLPPSSNPNLEFNCAIVNGLRTLKKHTFGMCKILWWKSMTCVMSYSSTVATNT